MAAASGVIAAKGQGWAILLADLALILFLVTASAVVPRDSVAASGPAGSGDAMPGAMPEAVPGVMQAVYEDAPGAPSLPEWIDSLAMGDSADLTIEAHYGDGELPQAMARAGELASEARARGKRAIVVFSPGEPGIRVRLSYDAQAGAELAR
ncbi:hypothetical protein GCM10010990_11850 [Croceicoccus mobilis]|uniref:Uncharacterized protein n=1 Tax=Croceicoccus mobilis TaxID=1703339 RepID=A0A916YWC4_9SPHN|nr:hypothetical protein GCM10010990_11850 [Croceicoccus mobilis]